MVRCALIVVVALSGCSQLFGLDHPQREIDAQPMVDEDGDGVTDDIDNCDTRANPEQTDVDLDGIGDVCQGCIILPLRAVDDDDGDRLSDDVDNCTGIMNSAMQSDDDADGIGSSCDPRAGIDKRFCLWTFRDAVDPESTSAWTESWALTPSWTVVNSRLSHLDASTPSLVETNVAFDAPMGIAFDTRMTLGSYTAPAATAVLLRLDGAGLDYVGCGANQPTNGNAVIQLARNDAVLDTYMLPGTLPQNIASFVRMTVLDQGSKARVTCSFQVQSFTATLNADLDLTFAGAHIVLGLTSATAHFDHVTLYKLGI